MAGFHRMTLGALQQRLRRRNTPTPMAAPKTMDGRMSGARILPSSWAAAMRRRGNGGVATTGGR